MHMSIVSLIRSTLYHITPSRLIISGIYTDHLRPSHDCWCPFANVQSATLHSSEQYAAQSQPAHRWTPSDPFAPSTLVWARASSDRRHHLHPRCPSCEPFTGSSGRFRAYHSFRVILWNASGRRKVLSLAVCVCFSPFAVHSFKEAGLLVVGFACLSALHLRDWS